MTANKTAAAVFAALLVGCGAAAPSEQQAAPSGGDPAEPPAIHSGEGRLDCTISARENGTQKLVLSKGNGLEFDVVVSPIVDGTVQTKGPDKGGAYRFSSHLAKPGRGKLAGVGPVTIDELETKVNVDMERYQQPGGPGTKLTFSSADMAKRGIYIEFSGRARDDGGQRYAFRVTLGTPGPGSGGAVVPEGPGASVPIMSKMVVIESPQTAVVSAPETSTVTTHVTKQR